MKTPSQPVPRYLALLPLILIGVSLLALVIANRSVSVRLGALSQNLVSERVSIQSVTGIRRDTRKTYVATLERRLTSSAVAPLPGTSSATLENLTQATRIFSEGRTNSETERRLRQRLRQAVHGWVQRLQEVGSPGSEPSVHDLRGRLKEIDELAEAVLELNSAGAQEDEAAVVRLHRQQAWIHASVPVLILASAGLLLFSWLRNRERARLAEAERTREEQARLTATLERVVAERTDDLRRANDELHRQAAELITANEALGKEMQVRLQMELNLRQAQKLEAVGRLAAGVAHEINTPVQFVSDSVHFVRESVVQLFELIDRLAEVQRSVMAGQPSQSAAIEAARAEDAAELPFLIENVPKALVRAMDGLERVATIVRSMKEFAHPDRNEMTPVDLNRAIQSTLTIATNEYKYVADLEASLGELPRVTCHLGDLNQAILNLVINAAHAIDDVVKGTDGKGTIRVSTHRDRDDVVISIADTGSGIPENVRGRIFDPFFTTKEVGKGTGQGLSIARAIVVDKHRGQLTFESEVGKGTTFLIRLPIEGPAATVP